MLTEGSVSATGSAITASRSETEPAIGFKACSFSWDAFSDSLTKGKKRRRNTRERFELQFFDEVSFKRGAINLIIGPTASGKVRKPCWILSCSAGLLNMKTSVLMALLDEMYYKPHGVGSWYGLPRESGIAYAPQESWVLNTTIRVSVLVS